MLEVICKMEARSYFAVLFRPQNKAEMVFVLGKIGQGDQIRVQINCNPDDGEHTLKMTSPRNDVHADGTDFLFILYLYVILELCFLSIFISLSQDYLLLCAHVT